MGWLCNVYQTQKICENSSLNEDLKAHNMCTGIGSLVTRKLKLKKSHRKSTKTFLDFFGGCHSSSLLTASLSSVSESLLVTAAEVEGLLGLGLLALAEVPAAPAARVGAASDEADDSAGDAGLGDPDELLVDERLIYPVPLEASSGMHEVSDRCLANT